jgi:hypothetical protein
MIFTASSHGFWAHSGYIDLTCQVTPESLEDRSMTLELDALDALGIAGIADAQVRGGWRSDGLGSGKRNWKPNFLSMFFMFFKTILTILHGCSTSFQAVSFFVELRDLDGQIKS